MLFAQGSIVLRDAIAGTYTSERVDSIVDQEPLLHCIVLYARCRLLINYRRTDLIG